MRDLLIQGMRRTGTTILFDAFVRDPRFTTYYEPLNVVGDAPLRGGGSGVHEGDLFADVRDARAHFGRSHPHVDLSMLNHGGPTRPEVEVEAELPAVIDTYLQQVLGRSRPSATKFVRMMAKIEHLGRLAPEAVLIWPVRDPRDVVRSYLLGRDNERADRYPSADAIFEARTRLDAWSVRRLSEALIARDRLEFDPPLSDAERVVLVWGAAVRAAETDGPAVFGDRGMRVRHEDFCRDPGGVLSAVFDRLEALPDPEVVAWCRSTVRLPEPWPVATDSRWQAVFDRLGVNDLVAALGY